MCGTKECSTKFQISVREDAMSLLHQFAYGYISTTFEEAHNSIPYIMIQTAVWPNKLDSVDNRV